MDGLELHGEKEMMKLCNWLALGLLLAVSASGVVAQQAEESDQPGERAQNCRIRVDEMEQFRRNRRLTKNC